MLVRVLAQMSGLRALILGSFGFWGWHCCLKGGPHESSDHMYMGD